MERRRQRSGSDQLHPTACRDGRRLHRDGWRRDCRHSRQTLSSGPYPARRNDRALHHWQWLEDHRRAGWRLPGRTPDRPEVDGVRKLSAADAETGRSARCHRRRNRGRSIDMPITVQIPTALRRHTAGVGSITCAASNLGDLFSVLDQKFPDLKPHLRDDKGQIRRFLNIYVNEEDISFLGGPAYAFQEGDEVLLVPSIAGGTR